MGSSLNALTLLLLALSTVMPLTTWFYRRVPIGKFYFRLLLVSLVAGIVGWAIFAVGITGLNLQLAGIAWLLALAATTFFYRGLSQIHPLVVSISSLFGIIVYVQVASRLIQPGFLVVLVQLITMAVTSVYAVLALEFQLTGLEHDYRERSRLQLLTITGLNILHLVWIGIIYLVGFGSLPLPTAYQYDLFSGFQQGILIGAVVIGVVIPILIAPAMISMIHDKASRRLRRLIWPVLAGSLSATTIFFYFHCQYGLLL